MTAEYSDYGFRDANEPHMFSHFMPPILAFIGEVKPGLRILDVGCGNGFVCGELIKRGCTVVGVDLGEQGIRLARIAHPAGRFEVLSADRKIIQQLDEDPFDIVVSTEVVEHLYAPREWALGCHAALKPGGKLICTTPFHGYLKNLLISLAGKWDSHANPLWDGGHIKLWSKQTLSALLQEAGFVNITIEGAGRFPGLWMTMVACATKQEDSKL